MKPFRIFRPGSHVASCGTRVEFTEEDLKRAAAVYNPQLYAAPLVIGHPKTEDRAYGWAESLSYEDGHLVVHPDKVEATFAQLVADGAYRNRSASFYMPDHPGNPSPGNLYPKHIGFLGAVPPALKGLGDVAFTEGAEPVDFREEHPDQVVEFADDANWGLANIIQTMARFMRGLRDLRIEEKGVEEADKVLPDYIITDAENQARDLRDKAMKAEGPLGAAFNETTNEEQTAMKTPAEIAELERIAAEHTASQASFAERETRLAAAERLASVDAIDRDQLQPLVKAGKLLPREARPLAEFMAGLDNAAATIEFGEPAEGQTEKPKVTARAFLANFLGTLPKRIDYAERGNATVANGGAMTPKQLADKAGELVTEARSKGRELSYREAVNQVLGQDGATVEESTQPQV